MVKKLTKQQYTKRVRIGSAIGGGAIAGGLVALSVGLPFAIPVGILTGIAGYKMDGSKKKKRHYRKVYSFSSQADIDRWAKNRKKRLGR